ncbi:MAG: hypothetical protein JWN94_4675 [Betaproteobacteria bacterium]|nr:hypothetical protein [Betaproteobacteria bacterium]
MPAAVHTHVHADQTAVVQAAARKVESAGARP